jgi:transcriptional antiterminator Rof (Rho-off)
MTGSDYRPIDCSVYDKLEETAVRPLHDPG